MRIRPVASHVVRWLQRVVFRRVHATIGGTEIGDAQLLADAERRAGVVPEDCAWLDARTVDDLDLPLVFRAIDYTATPTGAQVLWRWLVAPATDQRVLRARERKLAHVAETELRDAITNQLAGAARVDAPALPRLLWDAPPAQRHSIVPFAIAFALVSCALLAIWWPTFLLGALGIGVAAVLADSLLQHRHAEQAHALEVLGDTLERTARIVERCNLPSILLGDIATELGVRARLRRRLRVLNARDPFELLEVVRAALLIRWFVLRSCMRIVEQERARLRRIVLWLGELDALCSIARLRDRRSDTLVPDLVDGPLQLDACALVHPLVDNCVGNQVTLAPGMLVTGSNMSGKSTLLRTVAVNAILAQSIHTSFGHWRAPLLRVRAVMRIRDDVHAGMSTYAVEVAAIGELVAAATERGPLPSLFVLDEPFHGTNPAVRVPIVVAVLEHLGARDLVIGATHDLDVAKRLDPSFERAHFAELPTGEFDRRLHAGVAPSTNAIELLARAGYPRGLLARVERGRVPLA
ncbi:MAG TPA: hypothetical protein VIV40_20470 [Kofleriaceae bacterium]